MATCKQCGNEFSLLTAALGAGLCHACYRESRVPPEPVVATPSRRDDESPAPSPSSSAETTATTTFFDLFDKRYREAYHHAHLEVKIGRIVQVVGVALGVVVFLVGVSLGQEVRHSFGQSQASGGGALAGFLVGCLTGLPIFLAGVAIAAQGQMQLASLDSAVNSSRHLTDDEVERILRQRSLL
jgi:hypothetical protein